MAYSWLKWCLPALCAALTTAQAQTKLQLLGNAAGGCRLG